jgi:hypothetical protein
MSDTTGGLVLIGIFALAAVFAIWNGRLRASAARRLVALGFEPCAGDEPALAATWSALGAAVGASATVRITGAQRRTAGWGLCHQFDVHDQTQREGRHGESAHVDSSWPAYLLDLRDAEALHGAPVVLYVLKSESQVFRELLRNLVRLSAQGPELERARHPWSRQIFAAFGREHAKLDEVVPPAVQQRIALAAEHGFYAVQLANGKAAFSVLPGRRDVDREWAYLSRWC